MGLRILVCVGHVGPAFASPSNARRVIRRVIIWFHCWPEGKFGRAISRLTYRIEGWRWCLKWLVYPPSIHFVSWRRQNIGCLGGKTKAARVTGRAKNTAAPQCPDLHFLQHLQSSSRFTDANRHHRTARTLTTNTRSCGIHICACSC